MVDVVRRRKEDNAPRVGRDTVDNRRSRVWRSGPDEEDRTDTSQCCVERFGNGEVAGDDLDVRRKRGHTFGVMREGADRDVRVQQEVDDGTPDPAGRAGDEHRRHSCHEDLNIVCGGRTQCIMPSSRASL